MTTNQLIIVSICGLILAGLGVWYLVDQPPSSATLASTALTAKEPKERLHAAAELTLAKDRQRYAQLVRLLKESKDPEVLTVVLNGLVGQLDKDSLPLVFTALQNPDLSVRQAAYQDLLRHYGDSLPEGITYDPGAPSEARDVAAQSLKEFHEKMSKAKITLPPPDGNP